jgi:TPR repeat protein
MEHILSRPDRNLFSSAPSSPSSRPWFARRSWLYVAAAAVATGLAASFCPPFCVAPVDDGRAVAAAAPEFERDCARGDAPACNNLGVSYFRGDAVAPDGAKARALFERACSAGSPDACNNLGAMREHAAAGNPERLFEAAQLYQQACDGGAALGCSNLGALYARGEGLDQNLDLARQLFSAACERGNDVGCGNQQRLARLD